MRLMGISQMLSVPSCVRVIFLKVPEEFCPMANLARLKWDFFPYPNIEGKN